MLALAVYGDAGYVPAAIDLSHGAWGAGPWAAGPWGAGHWGAGPWGAGAWLVRKSIDCASLRFKKKLNDFFPRIFIILINNFPLNLFDWLLKGVVIGDNHH